ncbi:MAG TPA: hypothetical protein VFZ65_23210 [Planctomycetota bacterium]|nr:hypothetical protein [Planctomycetota bacterium]
MPTATPSTSFCSTAALAAVSLLAGCVSPVPQATGFASQPTVAPLTATALASSPSTETAPLQQGPGLSQIHPRFMATLGLAFGNTDFETNAGPTATPPSNATSASGYAGRLRAEYFFQNDVGIFFHGMLGTTDDILQDLGFADSSLDTQSAFLALSYRATVSNQFRMPVRFGPFLEASQVKSTPVGALAYAAGDLDRTHIGVRLAVEPEYIIMQHASGDRLAELSAFAEVACGAGPATSEDDVDKETGYAFTFGWEVGMRYKLPNGLLTGLSVMQQKNNYGATDSYRRVVFNGLDQDFTAVVISLGIRI